MLNASPALVNAGMTSVTPNALVTPEDTADVLNIFRCFGEAEVIAEPMIHPVVGVSGSSPAYVFMFIEAMADAAVLGGMPRGPRIAASVNNLLADCFYRRSFHQTAASGFLADTG